MKRPRVEQWSDGATVCSTKNVPVRARSAYWNGAIRVPLPGLAADFLGDEPIRASIKSRAFADARVTEIRNSPVRVTRKLPAGASGGYQLVLQLAEHGRFSHAGNEVLQSPGDLILLDTELAFDVTFPAGVRVLVWEIARDALGPLLAAPERAIGRRIPGKHGPGAVLADFACALARQAGTLGAPTQRSLQLHLATLTAVSMGATTEIQEARRVSWRVARRQQILGYVEAHLRESDLTAARAAHDLGMSRRWLYALFDQDGSSFAAWVARRRVEECMKLLSDPDHDHWSIAEIAFRCGFNDLSTFNRRFRARYAMTPRDARRSRRSSGSTT